MEAVKKYWFWGIFISVLSIFAMSHNASAADLTYNLNNYDNYITLVNPRLNCTFVSSDSVSTNLNGTNTFSCYYIQSNVASGSANIQGLKSITTVNSYDLKRDDLIEFFFIIQSNNLFSPNVDFQNVFSNFALLDIKEVDSFNFIQMQGDITNTAGNTQTVILDELQTIYKMYKVTLRVQNDGTYNIGLSSGGYIFETNVNNYGNRVSFTIKSIQVYRFSGSEENKEVEEKTQEAVDQSEAAGGSSSQSAQTGTTGLLNAITGAVNVISSASPTNCKINGNMGNLDIGQLDLCANPAPAFIQTIGSLILILMCVPLAISLFNRFITIFRSFQS